MQIRTTFDKINVGEPFYTGSLQWVKSSDTQAIASGRDQASDFEPYTAVEMDISDPDDSLPDAPVEVMG